ncbi:phosphate acetyltransferase [Tenacibaculum finnmarkense]|uniref:phosphate acetyltransferase n=1 Tax=Tenacibaculum finnmarkense TaxID=2781243 RepID=UPI000738EBDB|nr:phosphate acetyltransferase [Tenacibaculum finnmarkense]ALU76078.1 phosphate acetyltransferase [Tenacibaculum dicentrarchi]MBE7634736.1 phosphate acetyltransferase [Tenacibaculum finnmarkense genomovar ulcerans]MBE7646471.1 phosphate acetyltransferase [Tenacibaculum finnmarkense genomovar ulcerans]MBE7648436.1 phosphate acetyltransferase [Tenacibaculum finnmarkense genomovar ulcerans]MBE7688679.1 phosphate acetyltransferase [Tenacibaculum finnmarkense genomovar ulcerans]
MNKAVYIAASEANSGKSMLSLGLMQLLLRKKPKVGYFRPIIDNPIAGKKDNHINTIVNYFNIKCAYDDCYAFTRSELINKLNDDKEDEVISTIIEKYKILEQENDFVIVEGTDFSDHGAVIEMDLNVLIAKNLGIPVIIVSGGLNKTLDDFIQGLRLTYDSFVNKEVKVISVVANKIEASNIDAIIKEVGKNLPKDVSINAIPIHKKLNNPTIKELSNSIEAKILFGKEFLNNISGDIKVGAMQLANFLQHLTEGSVVVTPADRSDILLATLQANISTNYPSISGIVLTGGIALNPSIIKLIEGLEKTVPILWVKEGTFAVTTKLGSVRAHIYAENVDKIKMSINIFEKHVDVAALNEKLTTYKGTDILTPRMFQYNLLKKAKQVKKHIVLPEGNDDRILIAASQLQKTNVVKLTILGKKVLIQAAVKRLNISFDFDEIDIINPIESSYFNDFSNTLFELRKHKGLSPAMAEDLMADVSYFGTMMVHKGLADGMVSGAAHTTQHTIKPALQFIKTKPGYSVVSSIFFMCLEDRVSIFGDCAINPNPTAVQLAEIAISSADSSIAFGIDPKIAMLSYSSGASGKGEDVDTVREATEIIKQKRPDLKVEGPIQYDAAVDPSIGKKKMPNSKVAGQANVLIFPDLNTGNNTYKAVQRETGALAIGPMLQGLNKPVNDLSRGCTVDDIFNTIILTAIQAQDQ